eukprot:13621903-Ditylum_brightwellii.AAC.1
MRASLNVQQYTKPTVKLGLGSSLDLRGREGEKHAERSKPGTKQTPNRQHMMKKPGEQHGGDDHGQQQS